MMLEDQVVPDALPPPGAPVEWQVQTKVVENFVVNQKTNEWRYYQQKFLESLPHAEIRARVINCLT